MHILGSCEKKKKKVVADCKVHGLLTIYGTTLKLLLAYLYTYKREKI